MLYRLQDEGRSHRYWIYTKEDQREKGKYMANFITVTVTVTGKFLLAKEMDWGIHHGIPVCVLSCRVHASSLRSWGWTGGPTKPCWCSVSLHQFDRGPSRPFQRVHVLHTKVHQAWVWLWGPHEVTVRSVVFRVEVLGCKWVHLLSPHLHGHYGFFGSNRRQ